MRATIMLRAFTLLLFFSLAGLGLKTDCNAQGSYERKIEFNSITLTYNDLNSLIEKTRNVINSANANSKNDAVFEMLTVSDGATTIDLRGAQSSLVTQRVPPVAYKLTYIYNNPSAPISDVKIWCWDSTRELTVGGTSPDQVEALLALLEKELEAKASYLGGYRFRNNIGFLLFWMGGLLLILATSTTIISSFVVTLGKVVGPTFRFALFAGAILFLLIPVVSIFLPVDNWFPGFAVYAGSGSLYERHQLFFWFLGFLGASTIISILKKTFGSKNARSVIIPSPREGQPQESQKEECPSEVRQPPLTL
jgi:hypothetical protein